MEGYRIVAVRHIGDVECEPIFAHGAGIEACIGEGIIAPAKRHRFTARFMEALMKHYRVEARLDKLAVLVPSECKGPERP
jgi:hypothetical protein